jgi:minor extracellular serine protease Vpr
VNVSYASMPVATTPPVASSGGVLNDAGFAVGAPVAPGSIAAVFGTGFGMTTDGVTVLVGGIAAPLFGVYGTQINFQVPWQLNGHTQTTLTVTSADATSAPVTFPLASQGPGIFLLNSTGQAAVEIAGTATIAAAAGTFPGSRATQAGVDYITIYCTGLGAVTNQPATGALASGSPLSTTSGTVTVSIGGVNASVTFSGLAPGYLGLYQVNAQVPAEAPAGAAVPITVSIGGTSSNQATIAVAAAGS